MDAYPPTSSWRADVVVVLVELCSSLRFSTSSTAVMINVDLSVGIVIDASLLGRVFAQFEDLDVVHVDDQILRFFAEHVDLFGLIQVLQERLLVQMSLELLDQLLGLVLTICILLFECRKEYVKDSVVNGVVQGFPGTLRFVAWVPRWSSVWTSLILLVAVRIRFEYNPWQSWSKANLLVEILLCFENDCVWTCLIKLQVFLLSELQVTILAWFNS